ncbi:MAG: hypothetical protein KDJ16_05905 [Hyphomicrobiales bacterium]|nr:hypothetical protein [Hyphomicrobiales bacterium]
MRKILDLFRKRAANPDFGPIVDNAISLFAVYTGATLTFFVKDFLFADDAKRGYSNMPDVIGDWKLYAALAVAALLLRYIVGSAAHLRYTYIAKTTSRIHDGKTIVEERGQVPSGIHYLFIDMMFLIVFGILAMMITINTESPERLMWSMIYLVSAGAVWSVLALARSREEAFAIAWLGIDVAQIITIAVILNLPGWIPAAGEMTQAVLLCITFLGFLFVDMKIVTEMISRKADAEQETG